MSDQGKAAHGGLPWPEDYSDLLPAIREQWGLTEDIYLSRTLSGGKSGALVFAVDIVSADHAGQAILKLDRAPDPSWNEAHEAERHRKAIEGSSAFASAHLPKMLHVLHHGGHIAVLSTIAGRGLEYAEPWADCAYDQQLETLRALSQDLLEVWNEDYQLAKGMFMPEDLLSSWLAYRLDPEAGNLHRFLAETCGLAPEEPSFTFEGLWYPNPLAFATAARALPERLQLRAVTGRCHGDLHGFNVLVGRAQSTDTRYYLIDLALYQDGQFLFYDHAYFEAALLLGARGHPSPSNWASILHQLTPFDHPERAAGLKADDLGLIELIRTLRRQVVDWIDRHQGDRLSYMESQYLLARVATGLNHAHKPLAEESRRMAFVYAASNLKDYMSLNRLDWPRYGPPFEIEAGAGSIEKPKGIDAEGTAERREPRQAPLPPAAPTTIRSTGAVPVFDDESGDVHRADDDRTKAPSRIKTVVYEVRRRHVVRVAGVYVIIAWLCIQVANVLTASLNLPSWTDTLVTVLLVLGFPIACIFAWAFEISPDGLQLTKPATRPGNLYPPSTGVVDYIAAAGIVAILAFSVGNHVLDRFAAEPTAATGTSGLKSIAVLPFRNLSANQENESFSDGLTIEIMNTLSQTGKFRIPGTTSSFRYKTQPDDLRTIGKALGVEYILEGSVRRFGDKLRIEAQLVQADDGFLLWSKVYDEEMEDIFVIQQGIANAIGTALKTPLGIEATELRTERTNNPEAYDLFLKGLALLQRRGPALREAADLFSKSVEIEPKFAAGWAALSLTYDVLPTFLREVDSRPVIAVAYYRKALEAVLHAEKVDPDQPIVLHARGNVLRRLRQWTAAEDKYRQALEEEPNNRWVMKDYSQLLAVAGHFSRARAMADQMLQLDALNPLYELIEALLVWQSEHTEQGIEALIDIFEQHPEFGQIAFRSILGYMAQTDQLDRAKDLLKDCGACDPIWRDRALSMIDDIGTVSPDVIFDTYKESVFVSYPFFDAIGGAELVLKAFRYNALKSDRHLQLFTVPWALVDDVGQTDEFKDIVRDIGLVGYWQTRGWADRCRPLDGADFECGDSGSG